MSAWVSDVGRPSRDTERVNAGTSGTPDPLPVPPMLRWLFRNISVWTITLVISDLLNPRMPNAVFSNFCVGT